MGYIIRGDETHGKLYADAPGFHIEHFPEENECNDCFEAYLFLSTKCMEAQYNIILQSPPNAKRTIFTPQVGNSAILCSSYIYSLPNGEKTTKGEDGIAVNFGMPVVISNLTNDWCMHIPADTRSAFPVISVQSPVSIQCCWQS